MIVICNVNCVNKLLNAIKNKNRKLKFDHKYIISELPLFCHIIYFGDYQGEVQVKLNY